MLKKPKRENQLVKDFCFRIMEPTLELYMKI